MIAIAFVGLLVAALAMSGPAERPLDVYEWSDKMGSRGRRAWLLLVQGDRVVRFTGGNIPGVAVVRGSDYHKDGKWSHDTYRLELAPGVRAVAGHDGWETGCVDEGIGNAVGRKTPDTWPEMAECLGVSVPSAMALLRSWRPAAAEALDQVEQQLLDLEETSADEENDAVIATVSFGNPANGAARNGFWESPKGIPGFNAEIRLLDPSAGWVDGNIEVVGISGTVLSVTHSPGMHGGYYAVSVGVVPGTETEIPLFETAHDKAAKENGLPEDLFAAFNGSKERVREFVEKVEKLDLRKLNLSELYCGRARKLAEVIRVSGDPDFFLGADPNEAGDYIIRMAEEATK